MHASPEDSAEGLAQILATESQAYTNLAALARKEQIALTARDVSGLLKTLDDQQAQLTELHGLEQSRQACVRRAATDLNVIGDMSLKSLTQHLSPTLNDRLSRLRDEILGHVADLSTLNRQNALLLTSSLELTNATLNYLARGGISHAVYTPRGQRPNSVERSASLVLDRPA